MDSGIPQTRWATTTDGATIAYQDLGSGPLTLVVVHGWVSHLELYWEQPRFAAFMYRLARSMRVLHFDKRGTGMSDRVTGDIDIGLRVDEVRAVMDAAGVERAAIYGWGTGGPPVAIVFASTHPERTLALVTDGEIMTRRTDDYPWAMTEPELESTIATLKAGWGDREHVAEVTAFGMGEGPGQKPPQDPSEVAWEARFMRFAETPTSYEAFERMWFATDVRHVLPVVHVPTAVLYKSGDREWGRDTAAYVAERIPGAVLVEVPGVAPVPWVEEPEPLVSAIERFLASVREQEAEFDRILATVLFTDIVCSTERAAKLGDHEWRTLLDRHHSTIRSLLARYHGVEVKTLGDGFLAVFDSPARAVRCAEGICRAVKLLGMEERAGCHTGEIEMMGDDIGGLAVHIAARVAAKARPSEVLVSSTVKDLVAGSALTFVDRGSHALRGVPGRWKLFVCQAQ